MEFIRSLINNEGFKQKKEKKEMTTSGMILCLVFCIIFILYLVYLFIFQIECIIYEGQKTDGSINWGSVVGTFFLFMCCGPCMFVYKLINRCTNGKEVSNVGRVNTKSRRNTNVSAVPPQTNTSQRQVINSQ